MRGSWVAISTTNDGVKTKLVFAKTEAGCPSSSAP